jgi:hypothetical protein
MSLLKSFDELDAEQKLAWSMGFAEALASPTDLLAAVRGAVEDGTIEGKEIDTTTNMGWINWGRYRYGEFQGTYIVIGPVSDGGSET